MALAIFDLFNCRNQHSSVVMSTSMDILRKTSFQTIIVKICLSKKYSQEPCRKREELTIEDNGYMYIIATLKKSQDYGGIARMGRGHGGKWKRLFGEI